MAEKEGGRVTEEYISRKAVRDAIASLSIERFELTPAYRLYVEALDNVDKRVVKIPAADVAPVTGWIPVKERLPEPETEVLAAFDDGYVWAMWQKWSLADEYEEGESPFDYYKDVGAGIHTVTHWMPLPNPPEVKE